MNEPNKKGIHSTSLIDLKTELLRKKEEFQKEKAQGSTGRSRSLAKNKKSDIWSRSNAGVRSRAEKDYEAKQEDDDVLAKSRKMLEAKARAYDKMTSGNAIPDEDINDKFLVDFEKKAIDKLVEMKHQKEKEEQDIPSLKESQEVTLNVHMREEPVPEPDNPEEHWVDYIDGLGRSRRCMKKDLHSIKKIDEQLTGKKALEAEESLPDLMSGDMHREKLREQWEKEEQRSMEQPETHYANVQFNEVRDHGVAYYQLNKDTDVRKEQMENLSDLRKQTKQNREMQQKLKDKRKKMMATRLAKVRQRKMLREGKDPNEIMEEIVSSEDSDDDLVGSKISDKSTDPETLKRDDSWRRSAPVREWDKGKEDLQDFLSGHTVHSEASWKEKLRKERVDEFAPPSMYDETRHYYSGKRSSGAQPPNSETKKLKHKSNPKATFDTKSVPSVTTTCPPHVPDLGTMLANIRAKTEITQNETLKKEPKVTVSKSNSDLDVGKIPLPPSSSMPVKQNDVFQSVQNSVVTPAVGDLLQHDNYCTLDNPTTLYEAVTTAPHKWPSEDVTVRHSLAIDSLISGTHEGSSISEPPVVCSSITSVAPVTGPLPAHFSSGPMKPQMPKVRYQRVNLHELPLELPAPPTTTNIPEYPSQEEVYGPRNNSEMKSVVNPQTEGQAIRQWQRQFYYQKDRDNDNKKPDKIPFELPYVQSENKTDVDNDPAAKFDPSKPPPNS